MVQFVYVWCVINFLFYTNLNNSQKLSFKETYINFTESGSTVGASAEDQVGKRKPYKF